MGHHDHPTFPIVCHRCGFELFGTNYIVPLVDRWYTTVEGGRAFSLMCEECARAVVEIGNAIDQLTDGK